MKARACSVQRAFVDVEKGGGRDLLSLLYHSESRQAPTGLESRGDSPVQMVLYLQRIMGRVV